jgi:hypothetical protein
MDFESPYFPRSLLVTARIRRGFGGGHSNGKLLSLIRGQFDAFITVDSNLAYQQNLSTLPVAVVVLRAPPNKIEDPGPLLPGLLAALAILKPGALRDVSDTI